MLKETHQTVLIEVRDSFDKIIAYLESGGEVSGETSMTERVLPLSINPVRFRKQKPIAVLFGEERVAVKTWGDVHTTVITHCIQDPVYHGKMMELRGRIAVKSKVFIAETSDGMKKKKKICDGLYTEVTYGSETLMHILVTRILSAIRYDCTNIYVVLNGGVANG
jgi:hypothetical protein